MTIGAAGSGLAIQPVLQRERSQSANAAETQRPQQPEDNQSLSNDERQEVAELERTDREVRSHEQAHLAAAGGLARGVSFQFVTGPDGRQYAVAGEVSIDSSPVAGDPEQTIQKAQQIRAAANAPAQPSGQDRQVAAQAAQLEQQARAELAERQRQQQAAAFEQRDEQRNPDSRTTESSIQAYA